MRPRRLALPHRWQSPALGLLAPAAESAQNAERAAAPIAAPARGMVRPALPERVGPALPNCAVRTRRASRAAPVRWQCLPPKPETSSSFVVLRRAALHSLQARYSS